MVLLTELNLLLHGNASTGLSDQKCSQFARNANFLVILVINGAVFNLVVSVGARVGQIEQRFGALLTKVSSVSDAIGDVSVDTTLSLVGHHEVVGALHTKAIQIRRAVGYLGNTHAIGDHHSLLARFAGIHFSFI